MKTTSLTRALACAALTLPLLAVAQGTRQGSQTTPQSLPPGATSAEGDKGAVPAPAGAASGNATAGIGGAAGGSMGGAAGGSTGGAAGGSTGGATGATPGGATGTSPGGATGTMPVDPRTGSTPGQPPGAESARGDKALTPKGYGTPASGAGTGGTGTTGTGTTGTTR